MDLSNSLTCYPTIMLSERNTSNKRIFKAKIGCDERIKFLYVGNECAASYAFNKWG